MGEQADLVFTDGPWSLRYFGDLNFFETFGARSQAEIVALLSPFLRLAKGSGPRAIMVVFAGSTHLFDLFSAARGKQMPAEEFFVGAKRLQLPVVIASSPRSTIE